MRCRNQSLTLLLLDRKNCLPPQYGPLEDCVWEVVLLNDKSFGGRVMLQRLAVLVEAAAQAE